MAYRWGFGKPLLKIQGSRRKKKCSPLKVDVISQILTQKLKLIYHELLFKT